jgi:hypothetical protein
MNHNARRRGTTRAIAAAFVAAWVLIGSALLAATGFAQEAQLPWPQDGATFITPPVEAQVNAEDQRAADAEAARNTPAAIEARQASRTDYQDVSDAEAESIARELFPDLFLHRTWRPFDTPDGLEVDRYFGRNTALVIKSDEDLPAVGDPMTQEPEPAAMLESVLPLRDEDDAGQLRPLDPHLADEGDYFAPANAVADVELPENLSDGLTLDEANVTVTPQGAGEADDAERVGPDKVFYANVKTDTDFFATPLPTGAEAFWLLRSEASPTSLDLSVDAPPGSTVEAQDGGAVIADGADPLAAIEPPSAYDADGRQVPVELSVEDGDVQISVDHRDGDFAYPLVVDPNYVYYPAETDWYRWATATPGGYLDEIEGFGQAWGWGTNAPSRFFNAYYYGLWNSNIWNQNFALFDYSQWVWQAPANTEIERAEFYNTAHSHAAGENFCTTFGLWSWSAFNWEPTTYELHQDNSTIETGNGPETRCNPYNHSSDFLTVGSNPYQDFAGGDAEGTLNNAAVFQLFSNQSGPAYGQAANWIRGALFYMYDDADPVMVSGGRPSSDWTDDSIGGGTGGPGSGSQAYSLTTPARATDQGVGVKYFNLAGPNASGQWALLDQATHGCNGDRGDRCPKDLTSTDTRMDHQISYTLPEGSNTVQLGASDYTWRTSTPISWTQKIDRSAPALSLSGTLWDHRGDYPQILPAGSYTLSVAATDGSTSSPAAQRSGVKRITITVDGLPGQTTPDQACVAGSCPLSTNWTLDTSALTPGPHTVEVKATDQLGHQSSQAFQIMLDPRVTPVQNCGPSPTAESDTTIDEVELAVDPSVVTDTATSLLGERYGGASVDRTTCPAKVQVFIKDMNTGDDAALRAQLSAAGGVDINRVVTASVPYSEEQLESDSTEAADILANDNVAGPWATRHDVVAQDIHVEAASVPLTTRLSIDLAVDAPVVYDTGPNSPGLELFHDRDGGLPVEGGQEAVNDTCSVGFPVMAGNNEMWTTAGHCLGGINGVTVDCCGGVDGGEQVKNEFTQANSEGRRMVADAALINKGDGDISEQIIAGSIHRDLTKVVKQRNFAKGRSICYSGAGGQDDDGDSGCGDIIRHYDHWLGPDNQRRDHVICVQINSGQTYAQPGDSGGPVYRKAGNGRAAAGGVLIAGIESAGIFCFNPFSRVSEAFDGVTLATVDTPSVND